MKENAKKRAIVVGASSGIGREVARLLIAEGWTVGVAARRADRLEDLRAQATMTLDVTAPDADARLGQLIDALGGLDLYFHASGIGHQNRQLDAAVELGTMETNAVGFTRMVGAAYRYMAAQGHGHIAAITSIAGAKGLGPAPAYSATKALQNCYLQALEQLARGRGLDIRFTDLRPGFVDTDLLRDGHRYPLLLSPERVAREMVQSIDRGRHVRVIDWRWRLITACWRRIPRCLWRRFTFLVK